MDSIEIILENEGSQGTRNSGNIAEIDTMAPHLSSTNTPKFKKRKRNSKSVVCESIHELELKVKEIKKNLNQGFSPRPDSSWKRNKNNMTKEKYRKEKFDRCYKRMEVNFVKPSLNWNTSRVMHLKGDFREDCKKLAELLSTSNNEDMPSEFHKILKLHSAFSAFSYYEPDLQLPENLYLVKSWLKLIDSELPQNIIYYKGEMHGQQPEGRGVMLTTSSIYEGYFSKGFKQGLGRSISIKKYYTGYWSEDKYSGFGTLVKKSSIYSGEFEFGKESGLGIMKTHDSRYEGKWKLGKQHGQGVLRFNDKWVYKGEFCDGELQGSGTIILKNGKSLTGRWENRGIVGKAEKVYLDKEALPEFDLGEGLVNRKERKEKNKIKHREVLRRCD